MSILSLSRCRSRRAALHRGPVLSQPVPKQRHLQGTWGRLLVLLCAGFPGSPLPDWRERVRLRALQERRHLWGPIGQLLLPVPSWVHWWVTQLCRQFSLSWLSLLRESKGRFLGTVNNIRCVSMVHVKAQWWRRSLTKVVITREGAGPKQQEKKNPSFSFNAKRPTAAVTLWFLILVAILHRFVSPLDVFWSTSLLKMLWIRV